MFKVKHHRTADCVVAGFRWHKDGKGVGSLLLGLYDDEGTLHHVGVCASFTATFRTRAGATSWRRCARTRSTTTRGASGPRCQAHGERAHARRAVSRWNAQKDLSWEPVRIERVIEVEFDQLQSGRFRRVARFIRWRPDRDAGSRAPTPNSTSPSPVELAEVFGVPS